MVTVVLDYMVSRKLGGKTGAQVICSCWSEGLVIILAGKDRQYRWKGSGVRVHAE